MFEKKKNIISGKKEVSEKIINVRFIDVDIGQEFAFSNMPISQIPKSFEAHTTINIQGQNWEVIEAKPITSEEFCITGKLELFLRKINVESIPAEDILYLLPTISDELPAVKVGSSKIGKKVLEIHEDDWRQIEFVSVEFENEVDIHMDQVKLVYQRGSKKIDDFTAFTELYVRKGLAQPIVNNRIPLSELISYFVDGDIIDGLAYQRVAGTVENGFALKIDTGLYFYGLEKEGFVEVLCLKFVNRSSISSEVIDAISNIIQKYELIMVDWCALVKAKASDSVKEYFGS
jgi:hypothetical protein